jgi:parvulin-like peptidyl-prolyl isomerase
LSKNSDNLSSPDKGPERLGSKRLLIAVAVYFIAVSLIIGLPFYRIILAPGRHTILQVGERTFTPRDLIKRMRLKPPGPGTNQLEWATDVLQEIQNLELIRQEALKQKIEVSEQEVDREIKRRITASASSEEKFEDLYGSWLRRLRLKEEEYRTWVQSDIYRGKLFQRFLDKVPATAEQVRIYAIVTNTAMKAEAINARLKKGDDFSELAKEVSIDLETSKKGGEVGWIPKGVDELAIQGQTQNVGILTKTRDEAGQTRGETLAVKLIDDIAFNLPIGRVSPPLNTIKGFYFLKVAAREPHQPLSEEHRGLLANKAFMEWLTETARKGAKEGWIKWDWGSETYNWVIAHLD